MVDASRGAAQDGVTIDVVRTGGVALEQDSVRTQTAGGGHWRIAIGAVSAGDAVVDVIVTPVAPGRPYRVSGLRIHTVDRGGDALLLDRWVVDPYYPVQLELFYRMNPDSLAAGVAVEFRRTGGAELTNQVYIAATDRSGRVEAFLYNDFPTSLSDVVGDLTVTLPSPYGPSVTRGFRIGPPTYLFRAPIRVIRPGVGPSLRYVVQIYHRATGAPLSGVRVDVQRTGGIPVEPASYSVVSDKDGIVNLKTRPLASGTLKTRVTLRPPPPASVVVMDIDLPTFDSDIGRLYANWSVGPYLPYYGIVVVSGQGLTNVPIEVRRTDGIAVEPASFSTRTMGEGVFIVSPMPLALGDAIFEITIRSPPPFTPFVVRNVRVPAVEQDFPQGKAIWVWSLERGPSGPPGSIATPLTP